MEIHLLALLNNGAGPQTVKKYPLDSVTGNLMGAVRRGLSSSEHIVLWEGRQISPGAGAAAPPSLPGPGGTCRIPAGKGMPQARRALSSCWGARVAEMGVAMPAVPMPPDPPQAPQSPPCSSLGDLAEAPRGTDVAGMVTLPPMGRGVVRLSGG